MHHYAHLCSPIGNVYVHLKCSLSHFPFQHEYCDLQWFKITFQPIISDFFEQSSEDHVAVQIFFVAYTNIKVKAFILT